MNRRESLLALTGSLLLPTLRLSSEAIEPGESTNPHIATNTYPWRTFALREQAPYSRHTDELLHTVAKTGLQGYEPIIEDPAELNGLLPRLREHGLSMRSIYVNSSLHDPSQSNQSIDAVLAICNRLADFGTKIVVTNPSPIRWGGPENKNDQQLEHQANSLNTLGEKLRALGLTLAYHNHDAELRQGAREFHHMLTATDPVNVKFCLDAHWIFRGCGDSQIALFDSIDRYRDRIVELHLRQSTGGVWNEVFRIDGDINYGRLLHLVAQANLQPHLVLEQAVENGTPNRLGVAEAHRQGRMNLLKVLA